MEKNNQKNDYSSYFDNDDYQESLYYDDLYEKSGANISLSEKKLNNKKNNSSRRTAVIILSVFSVAVISMWIINFRYSLRSPFDFKGEISSSVNSNNSNNCPDGKCSGDNLTADNLQLKVVDTDKDGISDWDELFIYGTSPYLEDTDGDGLIDYEEIFTYKTNPICSEGQDCSNSSASVTSTEENSLYQEGESDLFSLLMSLEDSSDETNNNVTNSSGQQATSSLSGSQIDPNYLRSLLLESGFTKENLDKVSDEDLINIYAEVLNENNF